MTFGETLSQNRGVAPGFDFVRLFLSTAVALWHSMLLSGSNIDAGLFGPLIYFLVPAFFALSGFLVTGSLARLSLPVFMLFRVLRIAPALSVEVVLSALILGPVVTTLTLSGYFQSPLFWSYFQNMIGDIQYLLPGVFETHRFTAVNAPLNTVPSEGICYISLMLLTITGISRRRYLMLAGFIATCGLMLIVSLKFREILPLNKPSIILCFYGGSLMYYFKEEIPCSAALALGAGVASYFILAFSDRSFVFLGPALIAYLICWLGLQHMPHIPVLMNGDHSYGIYLYHFPVLQAIIWANGSPPLWWVLFFIGYPVTLMFAMFSWRYIEKPTLALRKLILRKETATIRKEQHA